MADSTGQPEVYQEEPEQDQYYDYYEEVPDFDELLDFATLKQVKKWVKEFLRLRALGKSSHEITAWYENIKRVYGPQLIGHWMCPRLITSYELDQNARLPYSGQVEYVSPECFDPSCPK